jgi:trehalose synthase
MPPRFNRCTAVLFTALTLLGGLAPVAPTARAESSADIEWLRERSMLNQGTALRERFDDPKEAWKYPFGLAQADAFLEDASTWIALYPASMLGREGQRYLDMIGDAEVLDVFADLGITAIHTGPIKRAGSVQGREYEPTIDGHFDRIELTVDPEFGDEESYRGAVSEASNHGILFIGDIVPGHTGKGPDFRLAERNVGEYPSLYSMVEIAPEDWPLLPDVAKGAESANLSRAAAEALRDKNYIVGPLDALVFGRPGIKETSWSATDVVRGVDGFDRRWVYLHIFKQGQPSLNWMDPSLPPIACRLVISFIL